MLSDKQISMDSFLFSVERDFRPSLCGWRDCGRLKGQACSRCDKASQALGRYRELREFRAALLKKDKAARDKSRRLEGVIGRFAFQGSQQPERRKSFKFFHIF